MINLFRADYTKELNKRLKQLEEHNMLSVTTPLEYDLLKIIKHNKKGEWLCHRIMCLQYLLMSRRKK